MSDNLINQTKIEQILHESYFYHILKASVYPLFNVIIDFMLQICDITTVRVFVILKRFEIRY